jgi:FkbM family methyltransferase
MMMRRQIKLITLLSIGENCLLVLGKIVSYFDKKATIAQKTLKEKRELNKLLTLGYQIKYAGSSNIVQSYVNGKSIVKSSLRRYSSDVMVFHQILVHEEYQPLVEYIKKYDSVNNILSIVDAGSNIGLSSLYLKVFFPAAKAYCVEPDSSNFEALCKNLKLNHLNDCTAIHAAIWHKNQMLSLSNNFRDGKDWSISVEAVEKKIDSPNKVEGITIAELMMQNNMSVIDILKIDIEGAERYIFSSIQSCETFLPVTKYLAMEIHEEFGILDQVKRILDNFGFDYFFAGELIIARNKRLMGF